MYHSPNLSVVQSIYISFQKRKTKMNQYLKDLVLYGDQDSGSLELPSVSGVCVCVCVCVCVVNAWASQVAQWAKNPPANGGDARDPDSILWLGRPPGGGHCNPLQYSCLENAHGQRNLVGCSLKGLKESNMAEATGHAHPCECLRTLLIALLISQWHSKGCYYLKTQKCL